MEEKISLTEKAENVLMSAKPDKHSPGVFLINRTLGAKTWMTSGRKGARAEICELYRLGLVKEWFTPWSPPLYLTQSGKEQYLMRRDHD